MPRSRLWSSFWTVAGFLLILAVLQMLADSLLTLFGLMGYINYAVEGWILAISRVAVPIWGALTFVDWRWGWKADNAGLRQTPAARFWLLPGLVGGLVVAALAYLLATGPLAGAMPELRLPVVPLTADLLFQLAVGLVGSFAVELVFRGVVVSRFQYDQTGRDLVLLAIGTPLAWAVAQPLVRELIGLRLSPPPAVSGLGTAALSVFLTLLFLRTNSVWLAAGIRMGLILGFGLMGLQPKQLEPALLILFGIGAGVMLFLEIDRLRTVRRPGPRGGGQRGGGRRVVYGKTVRGPWGPH